MHGKLTSYLCFLGFRIQGDLDGITCWRSRHGGVIWYPRAPPTCPPTELQVWHRQRWRAILDDWLALSDADRLSWINLALRASLHIHGLNLYIWWRCAQDDEPIKTLQRQTGITVL